MFLRLDQLAELLPLILGRVDTGRVLRAGVKQDLGMSFGIPLSKWMKHTIEPSSAFFCVSLFGNLMEGQLAWMSSFMPAKSSPIVFLSKYLQ